MVSRWGKMSLREAGVLLIDCVHKTPPASEIGYPYIAIPQLKNGRLDLSDVRCISREHFVEWTRKASPQTHDVILSRRCNPGETAFVPSGFEGALGQNLVLLRSDGQKVFLPFLRWLVRSPYWWEQVGTFINVGAVFDSLKCADIPNFQLPIPPLDEQKAIAHILGTLDDKIELNQQMNQTLEAIAGALFKSWFIDFDPVRAKLDGRQPAGMDAETAALFPAEFEDGGAIGKIPKGWEIKPFGELLDLTIGGDWGKETPDEKHTQPIAIIRGTDIASIKAGIFSKIPHRYTTSQKIKNRALSDGDIIIEVSGGSPDQPTGRSCYITNSILKKLDSVVVPASFCRLFRPKNSLLGIILKLHLEVLYEQGGTWVYQNQSTGISNFQTQYFLANELVLIPTLPVQKLFFDTIRPIANKQASDENFVLSQIRDALLPKLLSGEIRVQDAEKVVEVMA